MNEKSIPAGFWIRFGAMMIDGFILLPPALLIIADLIWWKNYFLIVLLSVPSFIYKPFMEALKGATLGKMVCGVRVVDGSGQNITIVKAYVRSLPNIAALCVALISQAFQFADPSFIAADTLLEFVKLGQSGPLASASVAIEVFIIVDCLYAAMNVDKRAIHDFLADSYCIRGGASPVAQSPESDQAFFCSNCDQEIPPDALICPHCGTKFEQ